MNLGEVKVDIEGDHLIVTLPGTTYRALFSLSPDGSRLLQAEQMAVNKRAPMSHEDFEEMAWEAANAKARDLGWLPKLGKPLGRRG